MLVCAALFARGCGTLAKLQAHEAELRALGVRTLPIFGSNARDEARPDSDVELVTASGIKPRLRRTIDREAALVA